MAAITSAQVAVSTTAVALNTAGSSGQVLTIKALTDAIALGKSDVTSTTGFQLAAGSTVTVELPSNVELFAIRVTADATAHVLRVLS